MGKPGGPSRCGQSEQLAPRKGGDQDVSAVGGGGAQREPQTWGRGWGGPGGGGAGRGRGWRGPGWAGRGLGVGVGVGATQQAVQLGAFTRNRPHLRAER